MVQKRGCDSSKLFALAISIVLGLVDSSAYAASENSIEQFQLDKWARPQVRLVIQQGGCLEVIDDDYQAGSRRIQGPLIAIEGRSARGLNMREIEKLLRGPLNSEVEISVFNRFSEIQTSRVKRVARTKYGLMSAEDMRGQLHLLEGPQSIAWGNDFNNYQSHFADNGLDLFERANQNFTISKLFALPVPKERLISRVLTEVLAASDSIGALDTSNYCLKLVLENQDFSSITQDFENTAPAKLIAHLKDTGRLSEAEKVCKNWIQFEELRRQKQEDSPANSPAYMARLQMLLASCQLQHPSDAEETLLKVADIRAKIPGAFTEMQSLWLGNAFEEVGNVEKALDIYATTKIRYSLDSDEKLPSNVAQIVGYRAVRLAQLQTKKNSVDSAIATLKDVLSEFDKLVDKSVVELDEKKAFLFPTRSDIEYELAKLCFTKGRAGNANSLSEAESYSLASIEKVKKAVGDQSPMLKPKLELLADVEDAMQKPTESKMFRESAARLDSATPVQFQKPSLDYDYNRFNFSCVEQPASETFQIFKTAYESIQKGEVAPSKQSIAKLKETYVGEVDFNQYMRRPLNKFCALLSLSRKLADHKRYDESLAILDFLKTAADSRELLPPLVQFLDVDKALTETMQGRSLDPWASVDNSNCMLGAELKRYEKSGDSNSWQIRELAVQENMRRFASLYSAARNLSRADILINRALKLCTSKSKDKTDFLKSPFQQSQILTLLEAAIIRTKQHRINQAEELSKTAFSLYPNALRTIIEKGRVDYDDKRFYEATNYKSVKLAQELCKAGQNELAVKLLKELLPNLLSLQKPSRDAYTKDGWDYYSTNVANSVVKAYAAKLLFSQGNAPQAFKYIATAITEAGGNAPFHYYLLAAEASAKVNDYTACAHYYGKAEESTCYSAVLNLGQVQPEIREKLLLEAVRFGEHAPSLDRTELASIFYRLANCVGQRVPTSIETLQESLRYLQRASDLTPDTNQQKQRILQDIINKKQLITSMELSISQSVNHEKISESDKKKAEKERASVQIAAALRAAELSDTNQPTLASSLWIRLADLEATTSNFESAIKHAQHGIDLYRKITYSDYRNCMLPSAWGLVTTLQKEGRSADAEKLLQAAIAKVIAVNGKNSPEAASQKAAYLEFLLSERRDSEALILVDQIIAMGIRQIEIGRYMSSAEEVITNLAQRPTEEKRQEIGIHLLNKLKDAQIKTFGKGDVRVRATLIALAKVLARLKMASDAEKCLQEAMEIEQLYHGKERAGAELASEMIQVFTQLGNKTEVAKYEKLAAKRFKLDPAMIDPQFYRENKRIAQLYENWRVDPHVENMLAEYKEAHLQAPYSARTTDALDTLIEYGRQKRNWQLLAEIAPKRIEISIHTLDRNAGHGGGCRPPRFRRLDFYGLAIEANLELGKKEEAMKWLNRITVENPELSGNELQELARLQNKLGLHNAAVEQLEKVELQVNSSSDWLFLSHAWDQIGEKNRAEKARQKEFWQRKLEDSQYKELEKVRW